MFVSELSGKTHRFVRDLLDELDRPLNRAAEDEKHRRERWQEAIAKRLRETQDDLILEELFWATYEKARDQWWQRQMERPPEIRQSS